jgi:D-alanyl-D-alanine carboxypeptidase
MTFLAALLFAAAIPASKLDVIGREIVATKAAPGIAIGVLRGGRVVDAKGFGVADLENAVPLTAQSVFPIASVTKTFTAAAVLQLVASGKVALDDDIGKYLPDLPLRGKGVTVRRLLDHTAGVPNLTANRAYWAQAANAIEPAELTKFFRDEPLDFEPGTRYAYSNSGYILLGLLIEKASGTSYPDYLRTHFFTPLGLTHTSYCGGSALVAGRVRGYVTEHGQFTNAPHIDMSQGYAAGGVCSTVGDLLRWQQALHRGEVLASEMHRAMIAAAAGRSYALGIGVGTHGAHRALFHYGGIFGFDAAIVTYPDDDVAIAVLVNSSDDVVGDVETRVARVVLGIADAAAQTLAPEQLARLAGTYRSARGYALRIVSREGALFLESEEAKPVRLTYIGEDTFRQEHSFDLVRLDGRTLALTHYGAVRFEAARGEPDR